MGSSDTEDLEKFGYRQQLQRTLGSFSSFALAFSLISINTGFFANFRHGFQQVGPALIWSWLVVLGGQLIVALVMAGLSKSMPLSGYGYQWSARLVNPHFGFFAGWFLLLQFMAGFPAVCSALASALIGLISPSQFDSSVATGLTIGMITLVTLIHLFGLRLVAWINNAGVYAELAGVAMIIAALYLALDWSGEIEWARLVDIRSYSSQSDPLNEGRVGISSLALSLLMGAWCLTGFEASADLAEETHQPRRTIPRAMILSLLCSGLAGLLLLIGVILNADDVSTLQRDEAPLLRILAAVFSLHLMRLVMVIVAISILACAIASMAGASRLIFSLSRDRMLPGSKWMGQVAEGKGTPRHAVIVVWLVSVAVVLIFRQTDLISSISAVAGYLGYSCVMIAALRPVETNKLQQGWRIRSLPILGLFWTIGLVLALAIPSTETPGWTDRHIPAKATSIALLAGIIIYAVSIRQKIVRGEAGPPENPDNNGMSLRQGSA
jgi:amino acid transporter